MKRDLGSQAVPSSEHASGKFPDQSHCENGGQMPTVKDLGDMDRIYKPVVEFDAGVS